MEPDAAPGGFFGEVVARPVAMTMVFLAAVVFGVVSYQRLPIELMPDLTYPTLTVRTTYDGAAPQEVEAQVSRPVEENLATLDGLVTLESRSRAGGSDVVLGFDWNTDMDAAAQAAREALQTTFLPDDADRPLLLRYDPSLEPFLRLAISYDPEVLRLPPEQALLLLRSLADKELKRTLEAMEGVAAVRVRGGLEREVRVELRKDWLAARQLTADQVRSALDAGNVNLAGGSVLEGDTEYLVRTLSQLQQVDDIAALRIRRADGVLVPLTDVATVRETHVERQVISQLDGAEAVEVEVFKEADANVVDVARDVKRLVLGGTPPVDEATLEAMEDGPRKQALADQVKAAKGLAATLPEGVRVALLDDQAAFIEEAIDNLRSAVLLGGLLAVVVLYLFLRDARATGIIGLAIPVSVVVGFAPLYLGGISLNLMSLGGLALGVGMLVDNAVVVLESIQRYLDEGRPRREAAVLGTQDVAAAVVASTLTTVAVFAPIGFVEGVGGELFGDLSLAVVGSLLASLAVALFLVPTVAALDPRPPEVPAEEAAAEGLLQRPLGAFREALAWCRARAWRWLLLPYLLARLLVEVLGALTLAALRWLTRVALALALRGRRAVSGPVGLVAGWFADRFQAVYLRVAGAYEATLGGVLRTPAGVVAGGAVLFVVALQATGWLGAELLPEVHQGRFTAELALPVGTPLDRTAGVVALLQEEIAGLDDVDVVYATIGSDGRADADADEGEHTARVRVQLTPGGSLAEREAAVMTQVRALLERVQHLDAQLVRPTLFSFRTPLEVVLHVDDLDRLREVGDGVVEALRARPELADVRTSLGRGYPEIRIVYDRERLARFGLDTSTAARAVRDRVQGVVATELHRGDERVELRVQLDEAERSSLADLERIDVGLANGSPIQLGAVATLTEAVGPSEIRRVDQQRAVVVSASLAGLDLSAGIEAIRATLATLALGDDVTWELGGQASELTGALASLGLALGLAIFLVYVIMASTFEHLVHPLVILFSVPLAYVGVVAGLALWGLPLSVVAFIGLIVLAGVVVNNAIVLVDAINRRRAEGLDRLDAVQRAGAMRLRPILITTSTTVLGLLPLAFGLGAGAEVQRPLAVAVIGGLTVSTLLTLGVVPAVYALATGGRRA
ncbi:MAG: efflux RND transporter permease subunit [Alphaproteobacteria bacterium]|nr:efflux RND transporter permease subunit [Alphaproteobacteria bacterium]